MSWMMRPGGLEHLVETSDKLLSTKVVKNENLSSFHVSNCEISTFTSCYGSSTQRLVRDLTTQEGMMGKPPHLQHAMEGLIPEDQPPGKG